MTKPFDLELAKSGHPVETRDGRKARIVCFDSLCDKSCRLLALIYSVSNDKEDILFYDNRGKINFSEDQALDLVMSSTKKKGWINVYKYPESHEKFSYTATQIYNSEKEARESQVINWVSTIEIEWEE